MGPISHLFSTFRTTAGTFFAKNSNVLVRVAAAVGGVAFGFFAMTGIARYFNPGAKPGSPPETPRGDPHPPNHLREAEQREAETIRTELLKLLDRTDAQWAMPGQKEQYERLKALFTGEGSLIGSATIQEGRTFLNALASQSPAEIINQQKKEYEEALLEDQLREMQKAEEKRMQQEVEELQSKISEATKALDVSIDSLKPHRRCWTQISNIVFYKSSIENLGEFFSQIETHHVNQEKQVDMTSPNDCFSNQVLSPDFQLSGKEDVFKSEKERLHSTYHVYLDRLERVKERLAWVRLKDYHSEVGEEFLKSHLNMDLLKKIREGKELPKPVTATSSSERSEGKREIE